MNKMFKIEVIKNGEVKIIIITKERLGDLNLPNVLIKRYYTFENEPKKWIKEEGER